LDVYFLAQEDAVAKIEKSKSSAKRQPNRVQRYIRETVGELRKVNWPTRQEATNLTIIVLIVTFSMSIVLGLLDFIYTRLIAFIL
jgi:preprotein translocase subunit SecE